MNKFKKILRIVSIIIICISGIIITSYFLIQNKKMKQFEKYLNSSENTIIYLGSKSCFYCNMFNPVMNYYKEEKDLDYLYIDLDEISEQNTYKILNELGIEDITNFGTPYIAIVKEKKVLYSGNSMNEYEIGKILIEYNFIDSIELPFNYINYNDYKDLINKKEQELILLGNINFENSLFRFEMFDYIKKNNLKINYFDLSFKSKEETDDFYNSYNILNNAKFELPLFMIIKGDELIDYVNKDLNKDKLVEILTKNDIIK